MASAPVTAPSSPNPPPSNTSTPPPSDSPPPSATPPPSSPPPSSPPPSSPPPSASPPPLSSSSPPPPSSSSSSPPPPPSSSSSPPPPSQSSSPSNSSPPPPSSPSSSSTPPPPKQDSSVSSGSSPPSSSSNDENHNDNTPAFSPPPPSSSSSSSRALSPPSPPPPHKSSSHTQSPSHSSGSSDNTALIVGVTAGAIGLLIVMLLIFMACSKKKRRHDHMQYYGDPGHGGKDSNKYYNSGQYPGWQHSPQLMEPGTGLPPPPGGRGWGAPPPPPMMMSSGEVSTFSGPHHPAMPPPSPGISLGLSNSSFSYDDLAIATNGFSQTNLLGQGGFGYVHKGVLPNGKVVAVKSLKSGSGQGEREFQAEVEIISRVHHRHLVSLVGYCIAGGQRMLVYEFVPNGTLEYHLYAKDRPPMDWPSRLRIALGSAKGLAYLHEDCHPKIIHRDIKAANILIDENFEAMVADFGLAKLSNDTNTHVSTRVMGTFGYMAPEYASSGKLTDKSDVFSYGVMLLELITGRRPIDTTNSYMEDSLVDWARPILAHALADGNYEELVDPRLEYNYEPEEMARMVACAAASVRHSARRRPKMRQIARALEGDATLDDLNDGPKPGQSAAFSMSAADGSSDYDTRSYNEDMKKFRRMALGSQEMASSEYGGTSEYGLNPSTSSDSSEMSRRRI